MKLQSKISTLLIPLVLTPLLALGFIASMHVKDMAQNETFEKTRITMSQFEHQVKSLLQTTVANVRLFVSSGLIQKHMTTPEEDRYLLTQAPVLRLFTSYQEAYPDYYEIRLFTPDGFEDTRLSHDWIENLQDDESETVYFKQMQKSRDDLLASFYRNPANQKISLLVSKRIRLRDASFDPIASEPITRGYLAVTVDLQFIDEWLGKNWIGENGVFFLTDDKGSILFHPVSEVIGKILPVEIFNELQSQSTFDAPLKRKYESASTLFFGRKLHGKLYLVAQIPEKELLAASRRLGIILALITLGTVLVSAILLFVFLKYILVRPIQKLSEAMGEIGRGNLNLQIDVHTEDEVGDLAKSFRDMSDSLLRSQDQIKHLAYHDHLTSLPNRLMFQEYLELSLARARRDNVILALLFIDLDDFKRINDTLGHQAGDELLRKVSDRLLDCLRGEDLVARPEPSEESTDEVARLGGDEFTVLLPSIKDSYGAAVVANRILKIFKDPYNIKHQEIFVTASVGITTYPHDASDAETLIKNADIAMYHAKTQGKNNYQYYEDSMNTAAFERLAMENSLRKALDNNELLLYYQPQVDADTQIIVGLEALIRWQHPELGMVQPGQFISLAEETGLIVPIGEFVLNEACRQLKEWHDKGFTYISVSVNLSSLQFQREPIDFLIKNTLQKHDLAPQFLDVELTESCIMQDERNAGAVLEAIKQMGVNISLDDFGTGYSSLSYLRRFSIDTLKIDREFVMGICKEKEDAAIISAIIEMAHILNLTVIAEGVEEVDQLEMLREKKCDVIQGFLFSRPLPPNEVEELIRAQRLEATEF